MKRSRKMLSVILGATFLLVLGAMFGPRTTHAIVATFVQVVNPTSQPVPTVKVMDPYQQFAFNFGCSNGNCTVFFPTVTKETLILRASCTFELMTGASVTFASLGTQNDNPRNALQPFVGVVGPNGNTNYGINTETYLYVAAGDTPQVEVFSNNAPVQSLLCTLSGDNITHN